MHFYLSHFTLLYLYLFSLSHLYSESPVYSLDHATISIYAVNRKTHEILIDQNSELSLIPASCMKIVTTAAALHFLDKDDRFETHLEYSGYIDQGVLHGNIYIRGGGDPCLGSDRMAGSLSWQDQLQTWTEAIKALGIHTIKGNVIADATKWEERLAVPSWSLEDTGNYYGAGACALSFHENAYSLFFAPGNQIGEKAVITLIDPPIPDLNLQNNVTLSHANSGDQSCIFGTEFSLFQTIEGTIPLSKHGFSVKGSIPNPAKCCETLLFEFLQKKGIHIEQTLLPNDVNCNRFHTTYSPPIKDIIHLTNQKSINIYAEHLLKKIGEVTAQGGSTEGGIKAIKHFLFSIGMNLKGIHIADGSGLSRKNLLTTKHLVQLLLYMEHSPSFSIFFDSLPKQTATIRAKSGSLAFIKGYVGYTDHIAFAVLINQSTNHSQNKQLIQKLFYDLATY